MANKTESSEFEVYREVVRYTGGTNKNGIAEFEHVGYEWVPMWGSPDDQSLEWLPLSAAKMAEVRASGQFITRKVK